MVRPVFHIQTFKPPIILHHYSSVFVLVLSTRIFKHFLFASRKSNITPSNVSCYHVSISPNHQTSLLNSLQRHLFTSTLTKSPNRSRLPHHLIPLSKIHTPSCTPNSKPTSIFNRPILINPNTSEKTNPPLPSKK